MSTFIRISGFVYITNIQRIFLRQAQFISIKTWASWQRELRIQPFIWRAFHPVGCSDIDTRQNEPEVRSLSCGPITTGDWVNDQNRGRQWGRIIFRINWPWKEAAKPAKRKTFKANFHSHRHRDLCKLCGV